MESISNSEFIFYIKVAFICFSKSWRLHLPFRDPASGSRLRVTLSGAALIFLTQPIPCLLRLGEHLSSNNLKVHSLGPCSSPSLHMSMNKKLVGSYMHVCQRKTGVSIFWHASNCRFGQNMEGLVTYTIGKIFSELLLL